MFKQTTSSKCLHAVKSITVLAVMLLLLELFTVPKQVAANVEWLKEMAGDLVTKSLCVIGCQENTSIGQSPHLWESIWGGQVIPSGLKPSQYDYQYDELQRFFIQRALIEGEQRATRYDFSTSSGDAAHLLRSQIRQKLGEVAGILPHLKTLDALSVILVSNEIDYSLYRVRFRNAQGLSIEGILSKPSFCLTRCPVLIAPNGYSSSPDAIMGLTAEAYEHQFGKVFAASGYVVFAVFIPATPYDSVKTAISERNAWLLANKSGTHYWAYWYIDKVLSAMDYVETLDYVDLNKVAIYGISMGGKAALYSTLLDSRIKALVVSGTNVLTPNSYMLLEQRRFAYPQDYIWDIAEMPDSDELLFAASPRPICAELGQYDTTGDFKLALDTAERVKAVYEREGIADRLLIAVHTLKTTPDGHETEITQCKGFLDRLFPLGKGEAGPS